MEIAAPVNVVPFSSAPVTCASSLKPFTSVLASRTRQLKVSELAPMTARCTVGPLSSSAVLPA